MSDRGGIYTPDFAGRRLRVPGRTVRTCHHRQQLGLRGSLPGVQALAVCHRQGRGLRGECSARVQDRLLPRRDDRAHALCALCRRGGCGRRGEPAISVHAPNVCSRERRAIRIGARLGAHRDSTLGDFTQPLLIESVRARNAGAAAIDDTQPERRVGLGHVLVNPGAGKPGQRGIAANVHRLRLVAASKLQRMLQHVIHGGVAHRFGHQRRTPTWTLRNRAGAAPWPTRCVCIGSPLPQFGTPHRVHASGPQMASQLPQKRGVIPV